MQILVARARQARDPEERISESRPEQASCFSSSYASLAADDRRLAGVLGAGIASEANNSRWNEGHQQQKVQTQSPDIMTNWPNLASWEIGSVENGKWAEVATVSEWEGG